MNSALEVHQLSVAYQGKRVLEDIDFLLEPGQLIGIIGPNGAGKSTLIKAIMGLVPLHSGEVKIFGQPLAKQRRQVGYVPQRESVDWDFPVNAYDVVMMGCYAHLGWFRGPGAAQHQLVRECLDKVSMSDFAQRQISQLSGGQQQRVFLARALAQQSKVYLLDEPFAGVDATTETAIVEVLRELRSQGALVLVVHHDLSRVREYFDQVLLLNLRLIAAGPTSECFTPEKLNQTYAGRLAFFPHPT